VLASQSPRKSPRSPTRTTRLDSRSVATLECGSQPTEQAGGRLTVAPAIPPGVHHSPRGARSEGNGGTPTRCPPLHFPPDLASKWAPLPTTGVTSHGRESHRKETLLFFRSPLRNNRRCSSGLRRRPLRGRPPERTEASPMGRHRPTTTNARPRCPPTRCHSRRVPGQRRSPHRQAAPPPRRMLRLPDVLLGLSGGDCGGTRLLPRPPLPHVC